MLWTTELATGGQHGDPPGERDALADPDHEFHRRADLASLQELPPNHRAWGRKAGRDKNTYRGDDGTTGAAERTALVRQAGIYLAPILAEGAREAADLILLGKEDGTILTYRAAR